MQSARDVIEKYRNQSITLVTGVELRRKIVSESIAPMAREIFADRALNADGTLVSRSQAGSVIHDKSVVVERSLRMVKDGRVAAASGEEIEVQAESLCLHGDTPGAVDTARSLKRELEAEDVQIVRLDALV